MCFKAFNMETENTQLIEEVKDLKELLQQKPGRNKDDRLDKYLMTLK